jgi:transposase
VISLAPGTKVFLACRPVDLRNGFDGVAAKVQQMIGADPFSGQLFLFRGKRGDYLKALYWDGTGLCLFAKRLEKGKFVWPPIAEVHRAGGSPSGDAHALDLVDLLPDFWTA